VEQNGWSFPIGMDRDETVARKYVVGVYPTNYLVDHAGKVVFRSAGWDEAGLRSALRTLGLK
jgi:hypothetical protein